MATVLLTGATGFVGGNVLDALVKNGYSVISTVRSEAKADPLREVYPDVKYEVVNSIIEEGAFDDVFKKYPDIEYVIHAASPVISDPQDVVNEVLEPAIKGTKSIANSAIEHGKNVSHFVLTSSFIAARNSIDPSTQDVINEESKNSVTYQAATDDPRNGYAASKTLGENALLDIVKKQQPKFKVTSILPSYVFGRPAVDVDAPSKLTSPQIVYDIIKNASNQRAEQASNGGNSYIHVNDVAEAHVQALKVPSDKPIRRWLLAAGYFQPQQIIDIVHERLPELRIPRGKPLSSEDIEKSESKLPKIDASKTQEELGITFKSLDETVYDTVKYFVDKDWF